MVDLIMMYCCCCFFFFLTGLQMSGMQAGCTQKMPQVDQDTMRTTNSELPTDSKLCYFC